MDENQRRRRHPNQRSSLLENLILLEKLTKGHRTSLPSPPATVAAGDGEERGRI
jgi:hypothetical protein